MSKNTKIFDTSSQRVNTTIFYFLFHVQTTLDPGLRIFLVYKIIFLHTILKII